MSILTNGFHPSFEALSALADQGELEASRTRVGRHVAHCAECRGVVAEIRSYGDDVRATEAPAMPDGLWGRIERGLQSSPASGSERQDSDGPARENEADRPPRGTPSPDHDAWRAAPALRPTTHVPSPIRRGMRRGLILLAAAAVVVGVLLVPTSKGDRLQASPSMGTWRFSPARPAPGATVRVRFEPPAGMTSLPSLMLVGRYAPDPEGTPQRTAWYRGPLLDSLAMLTRQADGAYAGQFVVPADFKAMYVRLADMRDGRRHRLNASPNDPMSRDIDPVALLVGGDARGEPSLASLTAALWVAPSPETYSVADTLIRYFPSEPIGYASDHRVGPRRLIDDLIAYFKRGERQYVKFDDRYMAQSVVPVEREVAMIAFAHRIDEPGEVRKWTMRLVREHGDDPRALYFYSSMLSGMLARRNTVDSVRAALPLADSLWERNGHHVADADMERVAAAVNDTVGARRWAIRTFTNHVRTFRAELGGIDPELMQDAGVRAQAVPLLRERAAESCARPAGKYSVWYGSDGWQFFCQLSRASAFNALSYAARLDGRLQEAIALADSASAVNAAAGGCAMSAPHQRRGEALLAMHDTTAAIPELAKGIGYLNWQAEKRKEALAVLLRGRVSRAQWDSLVARGTAEVTSCGAERSRRLRAERDSVLKADRAGR